MELGIAYGEHRILQIDIVDRQALRFAEPQSCAIEEQKQCAQGVGVELDRALTADGAEQAPQFVIGSRRKAAPTAVALARHQVPEAETGSRSHG